VGRNPIEFRRHYDLWIAAANRYTEALLKSLAGDGSERERLPVLLKECNEAHETFREECVQFFRSSSR